MRKMLSCESLERRTLFTAFVSVIDNPYMPLIAGSRYVYRGADEDGQSLRDLVVVLSETRTVAGVTCTVVRDRVYVDGELTEDTRDFYAQDKAGNVWYFGEDSRDIEDGAVVSREGSWLAGVNGAEAGIIMRSQPNSGDEYGQEHAPGIAEDRAEVLGAGTKVKTPFGTYGDALTIRETNPLESGAMENKFYGYGVGFLMSQDLNEDGEPEGEVLRLASVQLPANAFTTTIDNPYFPLVPGTTYLYRGQTEDNTPLLQRTSVLNETRVLNGVTCVTVRDRAYEAGELVEDTRDFYAQDLAGNVWYFGEDSRQIEDGEIVSREGSFFAGVNGASAGIIMRAQPRSGDAYQQENAPNVAEDEARVGGFGNKVITPFATFGNCLVTEEFTRLEPGVSENKFYAPGIGFIKTQHLDSGEVLRLAEIRFA